MCVCVCVCVCVRVCCVCFARASACVTYECIVGLFAHFVTSAQAITYLPQAAVVRSQLLPPCHCHVISAFIFKNSISALTSLNNEKISLIITLLANIDYSTVVMSLSCFTVILHGAGVL